MRSFNAVPSKILLAFIVFLFCAISAKAAGDNSGKFSPGNMIMHHIADDYQWHFFTYHNESGEHHVTLYLPVIIVSDKGVDVFFTSQFHHGDGAHGDEAHGGNEHTAGDHGNGNHAENTHAEGKGGAKAHGNEQTVTGSTGNEYKLYHGKIEEVNGATIYDISITKNVTSMLIAAILMFLIFTAVAKGYKKNEGRAPKGIQSFFEPIIVYVRDDIVIPNIGEKKYRKFLPYLLTLFFFIWINNLLGLIPTGANASGNIAFTMVLAVLTLILTNINGNKHYWGHILAMPGVPKWILIILTPVELVSIIVKPFALMIRLFANIAAGHIIILSLLSIIFIFESVFVGIPAAVFVLLMMMLELFVAALQAYIFTLLTALFIGQAVETHDEHH